MADTLTAVPSSFVVGETVEWTRSLTDYPATTWSLATAFINRTNKFSVNGVASGSDFTHTIAANTSAALTAGTYAWQTKATRTADGVVKLVETGVIEVLPSFAAATTLDTRSHAKAVLDAIKAVIAGRAEEDHLAMSIAGRSISKMSLAELISARSVYQSEYRREQEAAAIARGEATGGRVFVRFKN